MGGSLRDLTSDTLADQAYEAIREAIGSGELQRGEKITERGLAERLGVSPTPVREALRRLEQDRLVERTGPRSVRVAELGERTVLELILIESSLRAVAARLAAENATAADLRAMERALEAGDVEYTRAQAETDDAKRALSARRISGHMQEFHRLADRACHNDVLVHMLGMAEAFTREQRERAVHDLVLSHDQGPTGRYAQHRAVFDAIVDGDGPRAEALMLEHTRSGSHQFATILR